MLRGRIVYLGARPDVIAALEACAGGVPLDVAADLQSTPRRGATAMALFDVPDRPGRAGRSAARLRRTFPDAYVVGVTEALSGTLAVALLRNGANDLLTGEVDADAVEALLRRAGRPRPGREQRGDGRSLGIMGRSRAVRELLALIRRAAQSDATILVTGESGTGKELVARAVHRLSPRRDARFVPVNCGAIPSLLIESELFGYVRGAFTGAQEDKRGLLHEAESGTLFLDEVCDLPIQVQVKINRVLQERELRRVGDTVGQRVDVRFVAATNKSIEEEIRAGRFREDLYFRLNVLHIHTPPLRERGRDIVTLAEHFLRRQGERDGKRLEGFSPEATKAILAYYWPGNVRELENAMERAALLARGPLIELQDLPAAIPSVPRRHALGPPDYTLPYSDAMRRVYNAASQAYVEEVLTRSNGNVSQAARLAGLSRESLHRMMRRYGLNARDMRRDDPTEGPISGGGGGP